MRAPWFDAEYERNTDISYYQFFDMLQQRYGKDMQGKHRQN